MGSMFGCGIASGGTLGRVLSDLGIYGTGEFGSRSGRGVSGISSSSGNVSGWDTGWIISDAGTGCRGFFNEQNFDLTGSESYGEY